MNAVPSRELDHETAKRTRRLRHQVGRAIADFNMIEDGDRVMVCLSGGKDSWTLLDILLALQAKAPVRFELVAVHLDQKQPGYDADLMPRYLRARGLPFHVLEQDTYSVVRRLVPEGRTMCSLCSRLRRGALYAFAAEHGYSKIALGHHRDDIVETLFLNLFHQATLKAMPPKLRSDDGRNVLIRPLAYCTEDDIAAYARQQGFPILPCNLCGSQSEAQRKQMKTLIATLEEKNPTIRASMLAALGNVVPTALMDKRLKAPTAAQEAAPPADVFPIERLLGRRA
jgi:tRNA 2-thiocytidine biosynthesis protein TtcA